MKPELVKTDLITPSQKIVLDKIPLGTIAGYIRQRAQEEAPALLRGAKVSVVSTGDHGKGDLVITLDPTVLKTALAAYPDAKGQQRYLNAMARAIRTVTDRKIAEDEIHYGTTSVWVTEKNEIRLQLNGTVEHIASSEVDTLQNCINSLSKTRSRQAAAK